MGSYIVAITERTLIYQTVIFRDRTAFIQGAQKEIMQLQNTV